MIYLFVGLGFIGGIIIGFVLAYFHFTPKNKIIEEVAANEIKRTRKLATIEAERIITDSRKHIVELRKDTKKEEMDMRKRLQIQQEQADKRIMIKEEKFEQKAEKLEQVREKYEETIRELEKKKQTLDKKILSQDEVLEQTAKLSESEAKQKLLNLIEKKCNTELADSMKKHIALKEKEADKEAANIIVQSIQRYSAEVTSESTVTIVKIESDELKGKIIGREGRNINAFEMLTGVDVIVDDTHGVITISCFDMFRRYVAKLALTDLIKDGRIHPSKIEEFVSKAENKASQILLEIGQKACYDLSISALPDPILKLIGRLRFRTSYGQNVLQHSIEVAYIAESIANELEGANPEVCRKAGLLHDIGKAVSHEVEGGHAMIGHDILKKFGIDEELIFAMRSHHEDYPYATIESRILQAADAISAARPGARRETMEKYLKRLRELEGIASSFAGVEKVFAIQAGREVRVFVNAKEINDLKSEQLSFDIARKIENDCTYPGEVKVAIIRETKYENIAK